MTHKVHPYGHRLGIIKDWKSKWSLVSKNKYKEYLNTDLLVRNYLNKKLVKNYISDITFERNSDDDYQVNIYTSRSGILIGKDGKGSEKLTKEVSRIIKKNGLHFPKNIKINILDVKNPNADAGAIISGVVESLERKMPFKRILKQTAERAMSDKAVQGIRILVSGRLNGAEMARKEYVKEGRIPLQTFRGDVDYREGRANLPYGVIGVKVWLYRGQIFDK